MIDLITIYFTLLIPIGIFYSIIILSYTIGWFGLKFFIPENMVISFAGSFNNKQVKSFLKQTFKIDHTFNKPKEIYPVFSKKARKLLKIKISNNHIFTFFFLLMV